MCVLYMSIILLTFTDRTMPVKFHTWYFKSASSCFLILCMTCVLCKSELSLAYCVHCSQNRGHGRCHNKKAVDGRMPPLLCLQIQRGCAVHVYLTNPTTHWTCGVSWRIVLARSCPRFPCLYVCTYIFT
jgi:hypothetical protein